MLPSHVPGGGRCRPARSWGDDGTIVFATVETSTGLLRVSAEGGDAEAITRPDSSAGEIDHAFPSVLPGGRGVLFTVTAAGGAANGQVAVFDFKTGQRKTLIRRRLRPSTVDLRRISAGRVSDLRLRKSALRGTVQSRLPRGRRRPRDGRRSSDDVSGRSRNFSVSRNGTLVYAPAQPGEGRSLVWVTRQGTEEPLGAPARAYVQPRLSPDGQRVAVATADREIDIVIWDIKAGRLTPLTSGPEEELCPVWTHDGQRLIFSSTREGVANIFWQAADGSVIRSD